MRQSFCSTSQWCYSYNCLQYALFVMNITKVYCSLTYFVTIMLTEFTVTSNLINFAKILEENSIASCISKVIYQAKEINNPNIGITLINVESKLAMALHSTGFYFVSRRFYWRNDMIHNEVYLIKTKDCLELKEGIKLAKRDSFWNPKAKFFIIVEQVDNLNEVANILIGYNIFNVTVIYKYDNEYSLYTLSSHLDSCNRPASQTLEFYSTCSNYNNGTLFLHKESFAIKNCHIKLVAHDYWPYMSLKNRNLRGIENEYILTMWKKYYNITIELVDYGRSEEFGGVYENGTSYGMLRLIETGQVDGAIGGYAITLNRAQNMDCTYPYIIDYHRVVIRTAARLDLWQNVYSRLSTWCIIAMCLIFLLSSMTLRCFSIVNRDNKSALDNIIFVFRYFISNIKRDNSKPHYGFRTVVLSLLIYIFFVSCIFQAFLSSAKTHPLKMPQVNNLNIVLDNYSPVLQSTWQLSFDVKEYNVCKDKVDCMVEVKTSKEPFLYTVTSDTDFEIIIWKITDDVEPPLFRIRERVGYLYRSVIFARGSTVSKAFNVQLQKLVSAGITTKLYSDIVFKEKLRSYYRNINLSNYKFTPYKLGDLTKLYIVLVFGYCLSLFTFICELIFMSRKMAIDIL